MVRRKGLCRFVIMTMLSIFLLCHVTAFAANSDIPDATAQFYVNDFAGIINDELEKEMQNKAVTLAEVSDGIQVVVTTVQTIGDADPIYYTVDMYNKYGIGKNNMGVLIMLSVETRDIQIKLGDNMTKYLSDRKSGDIIDNYGIQYFKNNDFETGLYEMQNATIEHITSKVTTANNELSVGTTNTEKIENKGFFGMILAFLGIIGGGILSFFKLDKYFKKRKEKKALEEQERIENSELVQSLKQEIKKLETQLLKTIKEANETINNEEMRIKSITTELESTRKDFQNLQERYKRAIIAYSDLNEKVDAIFAKEKEEADKERALEVENHIREVLEIDCTRLNLNRFKRACDAFENLSCEQQKYVPAEVICEAKKLYHESARLQKEHEEEEKIRRDKAKAEEVQNLILNLLAYSVTRHNLSNLERGCRAYDNLTSDQKKYVTADIELLRDMKRKSKRLQDEYEEERRRRQREEEERRRRQQEEEARRRRASYQSSSSFGGSHSGFGGRSSGHGAGRKF